MGASAILSIDKGHDLLGRYRVEVAALEEQMLSGLTAGQAAELRHSLAVCRANLSRHPPP